MSTETKTYPSGPVIGGKDFPEVLNGWTRDQTWISDAASICGDLAVGDCTEVYYRKTLPDGRVLGIEICVFFQVSPEDYFSEAGVPADAEIFMEERTFFHAAPDQEAFDAQEFDVSDYEYEPAASFIRNLDNHEVTAKDMAWLVEYWGDLDARVWMNWDGKSVY